MSVAWSFEETLARAEYKDQGLTNGQVAEALTARFGRPFTKSAVKKRNQRIQTTTAPRRYQTAWAEPMVARLKALLVDPDPMPFSTMARVINGEFKTTFSRNAMIGKANRLGLVRTHIGSKSQQMRDVKRRSFLRPIKKISPLPKPRVTSMIEPTPLYHNEISPAGRCKFVTGDPKADFHYCGHPVCNEMTSYCPSHHWRIYQARDGRGVKADAVKVAA